MVESERFKLVQLLYLQIRIWALDGVAEFNKEWRLVFGNYSSISQLRESDAAGLYVRSTFDTENECMQPVSRLGSFPSNLGGGPRHSCLRLKIKTRSDFRLRFINWRLLLYPGFPCQLWSFPGFFFMST